MILPRNLIEKVSHYHVMYERPSQSDVIEIWWKPWWKRKTTFKFPRSVSSIDQVNELYTYEATPEFYALRDQLINLIEDTFLDNPPPITTKKEGNVTYIDRTKT